MPSNLAESSLKLRLAIQFGPPVNRLQNRFLIGTPCNEQNVRLRLASPRAAFPAFGFSRSFHPSGLPPRSFVDFRVSPSAPLAWRPAKTTTLSVNAHSLFLLLHAHLGFCFFLSFFFNEIIDIYIGLAIRAGKSVL